MSAPGQPDQFEVINGPEDGVTFPLTRTPVDIGADPSCSVYLGTDMDIRPRHARVTVVADGYRIRGLDEPRVRVDGKRAGMVRSRVVRQGGVIQVGNTELCLRCAPDGLASRSRGLPTESDVGWAMKLSAKGLGIALAMVWRTGRRFIGRLFVPIFLLVVALVVLRIFWPGLFHYLMQWVAYLIRLPLYYISRAFS